MRIGAVSCLNWQAMLRRVLSGSKEFLAQQLPQFNLPCLMKAWKIQTQFLKPSNGWEKERLSAASWAAQLAINRIRI